jgi:hypothetical protein
MFTIEYDKFDDCWYVKSRFGKILKSCYTKTEAEEWLENHKKEIEKAAKTA